VPVIVAPITFRAVAHAPAGHPETMKSGLWSAGLRPAPGPPRRRRSIFSGQGNRRQTAAIRFDGDRYLENESVFSGRHTGTPNHGRVHGIRRTPHLPGLWHRSPNVNQRSYGEDPHLSRDLPGRRATAWSGVPPHAASRQALAERRAVVPCMRARAQSSEPAGRAQSLPGSEK